MIELDHKTTTSENDSYSPHKQRLGFPFSSPRLKKIQFDLIIKSESGACNVDLSVYFLLKQKLI